MVDEVFNLSAGSHIKLLSVEHSVRLINYWQREDQPGLPYQEHPAAIEGRVHEEIH